MPEFDLIRSLNNPQQQEGPILAEGIAYDTLVVTTHDVGDMTVHIPQSTSSDFQTALEQQTIIVKHTVKKLLREYRGIDGT